MAKEPDSRSHRQLVVWQRAIELGCACYQVAKKLPPEERYEMGAQIRTACASVPSNIAEGKGRRTAAEYAHFLGIARGSTREVDSHLEFAVALGFLQPSEVAEPERLAEEVIRMLSAMMRKLRPL
jgi:four helix bundle protein